MRLQTFGDNLATKQQFGVKAPPQMTSVCVSVKASSSPCIPPLAMLVSGDVSTSPRDLRSHPLESQGQVRQDPRWERREGVRKERGETGRCTSFRPRSHVHTDSPRQAAPAHRCPSHLPAQISPLCGQRQLPPWSRLTGLCSLRVQSGINR